MQRITFKTCNILMWLRSWL